MFFFFPLGGKLLLHCFLFLSYMALIFLKMYCLTGFILLISHFKFIDTVIGYLENTENGRKISEFVYITSVVLLYHSVIIYCLRLD